ncbi:ABC transporter substrate-binding protein [Aquidulcibacter sp.]|jgi:spermidine/putrescine transport system substrate-binding protein|uniref:ABC transporter substrate-binding protein n=1 Tax=Aquidulcibacter sp. TaxID=2052990 RepID=UPI00078EC74F|nr:spermidine/putrescine ABC transporter substrate-binding protein [Aquidulcibacter sp.]AMS30337.1 spermidine/putrescine ABC transporter substrate-binding protein [Hyphomonadaceae bacterium UKL13-1]
MTERPLSREEVDLFLRLRPHSRRAFMAAFGATAAALTLSACKPAEPEAKTEGKLVIEGSEGNKLAFYNWDTYIGENTLADFKAASGVEVNMTLFANNDELFAKFRAGNPGFDVIMPSNEYVARMIEAKMLAPLDHAKIPNKKNLLPEFQDADFDPGRKYSMPYTWLVLGIGYRKSAMKGGVIPDSWKYLYDSDEYKGRLSLLSESADVFRLGFKYLGKSVNDATPELIKQVEDMLIKQKANIKNFHDDNGQDLLMSKEVDIVLEYNGDIAQKETEDPDLAFVVPKEGSLLNSDCMCIPTGAPNPNNAHAFINFLLDGQNGANITKTILYPTPNAAAKALMDDTYKNNPTIFPPADVMAKCEYGKYAGSKITQAFEAAMTRVRAA